MVLAYLIFSERKLLYKLEKKKTIKGLVISKKQLIGDASFKRKGWKTMWAFLWGHYLPSDLFFFTLLYVSFCVNESNETIVNWHIFIIVLFLLFSLSLFLFSPKIATTLWLSWFSDQQPTRTNHKSFTVTKKKQHLYNVTTTTSQPTPTKIKSFRRPPEPHRSCLSPRGKLYLKSDSDGKRKYEN